MYILLCVLSTISFAKVAHDGCPLLSFTSLPVQHSLAWHFTPPALSFFYSAANKHSLQDTDTALQEVTRWSSRSHRILSYLCFFRWTLRAACTTILPVCTAFALIVSLLSLSENYQWFLGPRKLHANTKQIVRGDFHSKNMSYISHKTRGNGLSFEKR
jgi:hypothetical protein